MQTLRAIIARDERAFLDGLHAFLTFHKSVAKKTPNDHANMVCWPALALARLAKAQGLPVAADGYLPARLLPDGPIR
jgi:hypothetical protein